MKRRNFLKNTLSRTAVLGAGLLAAESLIDVLGQNAPNSNNKLTAHNGSEKEKKKIKLGASVMIFKPKELEIVAPYIKAAGYDGTTISLNTLIGNFNTPKWKEEVKRLNTIASDNGLEFLIGGGGSAEPRHLFESAAALGVSILSAGPGGEPGDANSYQKGVDKLVAMARIAEEYKIHLVCKAHEGTSVATTPELLRLIKDVNSPYFCADIDPYHIFLAHETLPEAAKALVKYMKYAHIQDFNIDKEGKFARSNPVDRACGRGTANISEYVKVLIDGGYEGPLMVEFYGNELDLNTAIILAAEAHGYLNACLKIYGGNK